MGRFTERRPPAVEKRSAPAIEKRAVPVPEVEGVVISGENRRRWWAASSFGKAIGWALVRSVGSSEMGWCSGNLMGVNLRPGQGNDTSQGLSVSLLIGVANP
jgi:hypothetical protein